MVRRRAAAIRARAGPCRISWAGAWFGRRQPSRLGGARAVGEIGFRIGAWALRLLSPENWGPRTRGELRSDGDRQDASRPGGVVLSHDHLAAARGPARNVACGL